MQIEPYLSSFTKFTFKWIIDLNIKPDILNPIQEKVGNSLEYIGQGKNFEKNTNGSGLKINKR